MLRCAQTPVPSHCSNVHSFPSLVHGPPVPTLTCVQVPVPLHWSNVQSLASLVQTAPIPVFGWLHTPPWQKSAVQELPSSGHRVPSESTAQSFAHEFAPACVQ